MIFFILFQTMSDQDKNMTAFILEKFDKDSKTYESKTHKDKIDNVDVSTLKALVRLISERQISDPRPEEEYIEEKLRTICVQDDITKKDTLFNLYMTFHKHEDPLNQILADFVHNQKMRLTYFGEMRVIILILTFHLNETNIEEIKNILLKYHGSIVKKCVEFLTSYSFQNVMYMYFDQEYVDEQLKLVKRETLQKLHNELLKTNTEKKQTIIPKIVCKPFKTHYVKPVAKTTDPTECKREKDQNFFKAKPIPYDILNLNQDGIEREKEKKQRKREMQSKKLREEADKKMFRVAKRIGEKTKPHEIKPTESFKSKTNKLQRFPPVEIKTNTAQTLRQDANIVKEEENFEKIIRSIISGSFCNYEYKQYIEELRKQKEIEELENIERKRLEALITHEEAILSKKRLMEKNKREKYEFCKDWEEYEAKMNQIKEKEMEELKLQMYIDTKQREKNIQIKIKNMIDIKTNVAKEEKSRAKEDEEMRLQEIAEDIERKKQLVRQIKLLQQLAKLNNSNRVIFDEDEVINNGFMYEMSLAELKQRLKEIELEMKQELNLKKCRIMKDRENGRKLMEDTNKHIEYGRMAKIEMKKCLKEMKQQSKQRKSNSNANLDLKMKLLQLREERTGKLDY